MVYLKENSKIKDKFFKKILTQKFKKNWFADSKMGVDLFTGSTYTMVNKVAEAASS